MSAPSTREGDRGSGIHQIGVERNVTPRRRTPTRTTTTPAEEQDVFDGPMGGGADLISRYANSRPYSAERSHTKSELVARAATMARGGDFEGAFTLILNASAAHEAALRKGPAIRGKKKG